MSDLTTNPVLLEIDAQGIAHLVLNRVEKHNAFDASMIAYLSEHLQSLQQDTSVRLIWLKSSGPHFSAGADLNWMKDSVHFSKEENYQDALNLGQLMHQLYYSSKPTVATVQGACYGGGIGLVACCHIALTSLEAHFCFSETKLGLIPAVISPYVVQAIGHRRAQSLFLSADIFNGLKAYEWGLCYEAVEQAHLETRSTAIIRSLLNNSPEALHATIKLMRHIKNRPLDNSLMEYTATQIASIRASEEGQEGLHAFLEKRKPSWHREIE